MNLAPLDKNRTLRSIILLAVGALVSVVGPACGGRLGNDIPGNTGGSAGSGAGGAPGASGGPGAGGTQDSCPSAKPVDGTVCVISSRPCSYERCGDPTGVTFTCVSGHWLESPDSASCGPVPLPPPVDAGTPAPARDAGAVPTPGSSNGPPPTKDCNDEFSGGTPAYCCPTAPDCKGKADGWPGYPCVSRENQFCSCQCQAESWACAC